MISAVGHRSRISQVAAAAVLVLVYTSAALAQTPVQILPPAGSTQSGDLAKTITGTSAVILAGGNYAFVKIFNQSAADTIRCRWGPFTAVNSDTAGQYTFLPYSGYVWDATDPPPVNQALNCVSSGTSTPSTVRAF